MVKIFIKDIVAGMELKSSFLITYIESKVIGEKVILRLQLNDSTGSIVASYSSNALAGSKSVPGLELSVGDVIEFSARASELNGKLQLEIDPPSIRKLSSDEISANMLDFVPRAARDVKEMLSELLSYIDGIRNSHLKALLQNFFSDKKFVEEFCIAPAALRHHHNYAGGLLEHTLGVVQICDVSARAHPSLDRDLLIAGAALHDIGKVKEYVWKPKLERTDIGGLLGHAMLGIDMLNARCPHDFPEELKLKIHHMVVSHHGRSEWGAAVMPEFAEAAALHYADNLDAKVKEFIEEGRRGDGGIGWTFSQLLGRYIYLGQKSNKEKEQQ